MEASPYTTSEQTEEQTLSSATRRRSLLPVLNVDSDEYRRKIVQYLSTGQPKLAVGLEQTVSDDPSKGRSVKTRSHIQKGQFVVEYKGDLIDSVEAEKRERALLEDGILDSYMFYFQHSRRTWWFVKDTTKDDAMHPLICCSHCSIDSTDERPEFGLARLINHSRTSPNLIARKFIDKQRQPHIAFLASRDINVGEELAFDYGDRRPEAVRIHKWLSG